MFVPLEELLGPDFGGLCAQIGLAAGDCQMRAYLIGGIVRDLLPMLGFGAVRHKAGRICFPDIDIMLEGDALVMVKHLRDHWRKYFPQTPMPAKVASYRHYKTAKLLFNEEILPGVDRLDFSTARSEMYPTPGGRPVISAGDLGDDLARRDFSINAMAISLVPGDMGMLCDRFEGQLDLHEKRIKVLHERSFIDDPARLIRAVRFVVRLQFRLEENTAMLFVEYSMSFEKH
jgi:tRNA nucleotidyltransferase (CCA-adding enzyme)